MFLGNKKCRIYAVLWRFANAYIGRKCEEIQEAVKKSGNHRSGGKYLVRRINCEIKYAITENNNLYHTRKERIN